MFFNVNDYVSVRLTDEGRKIAEDWYWIAPSFKVEEDEEGFSKWQLWNLMQIFGQHLYLGGPMPFDSQIVLAEVRGEK